MTKYQLRKHVATLLTLRISRHPYHKIRLALLHKAMRGCEKSKRQLAIMASQDRAYKAAL